ncbi:MAG: hypothetical protein IJ157_02140 [Clostridia bacterium]|nr:hypothetical protein [Clostridia bacterium]
MPRFIINDKWYGWSAPEGEMKRAKRLLPLLTAVNLALSVACGLIPTGVSRHNWVAFAATAALVALAAEIVGVVRFCRAKSQMYQREFEAIDHFIRLPCLLHMLLTAAAVIAAVVSCIQNWTGWLDALLLILLASTGACSFLVYNYYRALPTFEMKQPE